MPVGGRVAAMIRSRSIDGKGTRQRDDARRPQTNRSERTRPPRSLRSLRGSADQRWTQDASVSVPRRICVFPEFPANPAGNTAGHGDTGRIAMPTPEEASEPANHVSAAALEQSNGFAFKRNREFPRENRKQCSVFFLFFFFFSPPPPL